MLVCPVAGRWLHGASAAASIAAAIAALLDMFGPRSRRLSRQMLVEEAGDLAERLLGLRRKGVEVVLRVRHALEHLQLRLHAGAAQLAVGEHGEAQEQVARAAGEDGGREAGEVAIDRRELRVLEVAAVGIEQRRSEEHTSELQS